MWWKFYWFLITIHQRFEFENCKFLSKFFLFLFVPSLILPNQKINSIDLIRTNELKVLNQDVNERAGCEFINRDAKTKKLKVGVLEGFISI